MIRHVTWSAVDKSRGIAYVVCPHCGKDIVLKFDSVSETPDPKRFGTYKLISGDSKENLTFEQIAKIEGHFNSRIIEGSFSN